MHVLFGLLLIDANFDFLYNKSHILDRKSTKEGLMRNKIQSESCHLQVVSFFWVVKSITPSLGP